MLEDSVMVVGGAGEWVVSSECQKSVYNTKHTTIHNLCCLNIKGISVLNDKP